jgi:hypothetical protein
MRYLIALKHTIICGLLFISNEITASNNVFTDTAKVKTADSLNNKKFPIFSNKDKSWIFLNFGAAYYTNYSDIALKYPDFTSFPISLEYQHQGSWVGSLEYNIYFGNNVNTNGFFNNISNENGDIIDMNGHPAVIRARLRGFSSRAYVSKNFYPFQKLTKKHLALQIGIGGGYSQTYIDYQVDQGTVPQIEGNNITGYDKLAGGYQIAERIRIQYFNFNAISCVLGFDFIQGVAHSLRPWDFGNNKADNEAINEITAGVHFGLIIPIRIDQKLRDQEYFMD